MPDLIAQGVEPQQRWRRSLPEGQAVLLGRLGGTWAVPWDQHVSRRHARLLWSGKRLEVARLPETRNPIFLRGKEVDQFSIEPGEHFVIGQTSFTLADQRVNITADAPQPVQQQSFSANICGKSSSAIPTIGSKSSRGCPTSFPARPAMKNCSSASSACSWPASPAPMPPPSWRSKRGEGRGEGEEGRRRTVERSPSKNDRCEANEQLDSTFLLPLPPSPLPSPLVLHWDQRLVVSNDFTPSQGLILEALRQRQSVLHVWHGAETGSPAAFTESENYDWAFCTPVLGKACAGWGLYVAGRFNVERLGVTQSSDPTDLREDVKFTELVAAMLSSLRQMRLLEHRHATLEPVLFARRARYAGGRRPRNRARAAGDRSLGAVLRFARLLPRVGTLRRRSAWASCSASARPWA